MPPAAVTPAGEQIAAAAARYVGQGYNYGGPGWPPGNWDCSSFVSAVLGHDLGMGLPGGRWGGPGMPPAVHGPVVLSYVTWGGADPVPAGQEQAGDLVCWPGVGTGGHIGIVQGPNEMVSALDPIIQGNAQTGTARTPIQGWGPTNVYVYRRVKGTGTAPAATTGAAGWGSLVLPILAGVALGGGLILGVVALAGGLAAGALWVAYRAAGEVVG